MEFILHFMYVVAIKDTRTWQGASPMELSMVGFWNLIILWLKVFVLVSSVHSEMPNVFAVAVTVAMAAGTIAVASAADWPFSSIHRHVRLGTLPADWSTPTDRRFVG